MTAIKRYVSIRFPVEAQMGFKSKQQVIGEMIKEMTKKKVVKNPPLTDVLNFYANKKSTIYYTDVKDFFLRKKQRGLRYIA